MRNWKRLDLEKPPVKEHAVLLCGSQKGYGHRYEFPLFELGCFAYDGDRLWWYSNVQTLDVAELAASYYLWWCPVPAFDGV